MRRQLNSLHSSSLLVRRENNVIKAIIFDFAGVIATEAYWIWLRKTVGDLDSKKREFQSLADRVDSGEVSNKAFVAELSNNTGVTEDLIWPQVLEEVVINQDLLDLIKDIKQKYLIGLLSNYTHDWLEQIIVKYSLSQYFDQVVISSKIGHIKPEAQAFQAILDELDVVKEEAIFIDDRQEHVNASNAFGLKALLYITVPELKTNLENFGVQSL